MTRARSPGESWAKVSAPETFEVLVGTPLKLPARLAPWEYHFRVAGVEWGLPPLLLASVCDVESGGGTLLKPAGPEGLIEGRTCGRQGQSLGLMGVQTHAWWIWARDCNWKDALTNIRKGASILAGELQRFSQSSERQGAGDTVTLAAAIAAYDCGAAQVREALRKRGNVDLYTRKGCYSAEVLTRLDRLTDGQGLR